jgi:hypothetical protein
MPALQCHMQSGRCIQNDFHEMSDSRRSTISVFALPALKLVSQLHGLL